MKSTCFSIPKREACKWSKFGSDLQENTPHIRYKYTVTNVYGNNLYFVGFEVLTAVSMKMAVFWVHSHLQSLFFCKPDKTYKCTRRSDKHADLRVLLNVSTRHTHALVCITFCCLPAYWKVTKTWLSNVMWCITRVIHSTLQNNQYTSLYFFSPHSYAHK
jgi:hypothetical protein